MACYAKVVSHQTVFSPRTATRGLVTSRKMSVNKPSTSLGVRVIAGKKFRKFRNFCYALECVPCRDLIVKLP